MGKFPAIAVVGSRGFESRPIVDAFIYRLPKDWTIISGGAKGVDSWAEETAKHHMRHTICYPADWARHGRAAGFIRNNEIVRAADVIVAFWDGKSKGTKHSIQLCKYLNKPCVIVRLG